MNFPQFAFNNVKRNGRAYIAYLLSSSFMVMIFFTYAVFIYHPEIKRNPMGPMTQAGMQVAAYVVYIFAIFFVLYSISVFLKSRNKEFGILMILGAKAGQINRLIFLENMLIGAISIVTGIASGLLLSKLFLLLSTKIISMDNLPFYWPIKAIMLTSACFIALFLFISLFTLLFIRKNRILELLKGNSKPKKEPKASILLSLFGAALLSVGFVTLRLGELSPMVIFVAAGSGIAGTYFFYSQLSVLLIRLLQRNRKRTWRGTNLLWISEMSYKIKDNARMLFLVTVVTSVACMSAGFVLAIDQTSKQAFLKNPFALNYTVYNDQFLPAELDHIESEIKAAGVDYKRFKAEISYSRVENSIPGNADIRYISVFSMSTFNELSEALDTRPVQELAKDSAVVLYTGKEIATGSEIKLEHAPGAVIVTDKRKVETLASLSYKEALLVVNDTVFEQMKESLISNETRPSIHYLYTVPAWDHLPAKDEAQSLIGSSLYEWNRNQLNDHQSENYLRIRADDYWNTKQATSLFSFIGIFVALIFSISTASFLYFKLHTELAADSRMYHALSKIGLSTREMSASATKQIAFLFFVPIVISTVQTLVVLSPILSYMKVSYVNQSTFIVALAFLAAQTIYFIIARLRYVNTLKKMMV
ncbi:FtsX-like permease family protein [Paenibacillus eucommiae]|uniref:ABC transport system permease protein n=1 Tax=Paenibacillus eucommiae TaxID=1355755 RepID=A0ABS4IN79_9BACL|nr:ABC transporter permease [Paenibacillus eucommiae]MBP1989016.1 putative ABC transport system permease protein [Paenibacillus eucommiae]